MTHSVVRQLVLKDLYLVRWMVAGSLAGGAVALGLMPLGPVPSYVSAVTLICVLVILNIVLVMSSIVQERKDKVLLFILSLPVSTSQYTAAKVISNTVAFGLTWLVLVVASAIVIDIAPISNGLLPVWIAILAYLFGYYGVLTAVALVSESTGWHATTITIGNISVNFLIPLLLGMRSVIEHRNSPVAVWTNDFIVIIAIELAVGVVALCLGVYLRSRATDFV